MCKKHCDFKGGCRVHLPPPPPPPQPLPPLTGRNLDILHAIHDDANTIPRAAHRLAQDALQNEHERRAAIATIPSPTPSPPHLAPVKYHFVLVHWAHHNEPPAMKVRANDVHSVTPGQPLLIRALGITGSEEAAYIARARSHAEHEFNSLVPRPPIKRKATVVCESDDDEVVVVSSSRGASATAVGPPKRPRLPIRPRPQVNVESDSDVVVIDSPTPQRRPGILTRAFSSPIPSRVSSSSSVGLSTRPRLSISTHALSPVPSLASSSSTGPSTRIIAATTRVRRARPGSKLMTMSTFFGRFRAGRFSRSSPPCEDATASSSSTITFRAFPDPTPPSPQAAPVGSLEYDLQCPKYQERWESFDAFQNGAFPRRRRRRHFDLRLGVIRKLSL
ncbi:hypothetical protein B0H13DRAFT_2315126 [Mycena leptocephala]|nr:hypothetical protein B0H13DRAFT_2315126 [Mycena leptocephala]